jgi:RNase P/RNase MRP subunit POP5
MMNNTKNFKKKLIFRLKISGTIKKILALKMKTTPKKSLYLLIFKINGTIENMISF